MKIPPIFAIAKNGKLVRIPLETLELQGNQQLLRDSPKNFRAWKDFELETGYPLKRYFAFWKEQNGDYIWVWRRKPLMTKNERAAVLAGVAAVMGLISLASIWGLTSFTTPIEIWRAGFSATMFAGMLVLGIIATATFLPDDF